MRYLVFLPMALVLIGCSSNSTSKPSSEQGRVESNPNSTSDASPPNQDANSTNDSTFFVVDVRSKAEWDSGHVEQAVHIPHTEIGERISEVTNDKNAKIVVYCRVGGRAKIAKEKLEELGFTNVENGGGFDDVKDRFMENAQAPDSPPNEDNTSAIQYWDGQVVQHGRMHEVIGQQKHGGRVRLSDAVKRPHFFAVGALEGLAGEVTILDGKVFATEVVSKTEIAPIDSEGAASAALLVGSHVSTWTEHTVGESVPRSQLDDFLEKTAARAGLDTSKPFVFTVNGQLQDLQMHVIRGACPVHAKRSGVKLPEGQQPHVSSVAETNGVLVGVFAKDAAGNITHPGTSTHVHAILEVEGSGKRVTGHVDHVSIGAGALLRLPKLE